MNAQLTATPASSLLVNEGEWRERMRTTSDPAGQGALLAQASAARDTGDASAALALAYWQSLGLGGVKRDELAALDALESHFDGPLGLLAKARAAAVHLRLGSLGPATALAQAAADGGDPEGMVALGDVLGRDGADLLAAARWYRRAHDAGEVQGSMRWAKCLLDGRGVAADAVQGEAVLNTLADDGIGEAAYMLAQVKGGQASSLREHHNEKAKWLARAAADGFAPAMRELADVRNEQAWDFERLFKFGAVELEAFVKTGVLTQVSVDRRSSVVGTGNTVRTVHHESPVYEVEFESGTQRLAVKPYGPQAAAPGTRLRMLVLGKAGTLEGTCVSLTDSRGQRYALIETDELARGLGIYVPKAGPTAFWAMVMLAWLIFSWNYFFPTLVFSFLGTCIAGYFLYRQFSLTSKLWQQVQRLEAFWGGRAV